MSLVFKDVVQSGGFFKPADHKDAVALLVEVAKFEHQRPTPHGPKDSVIADVTVFATEASLDAGEPTDTLKGQRIEQTVLAKDLADFVGAATIVCLAQVQGKKSPNPAWVWRQVSQDVKSKVIAYATKREEAIQAALASVPDFED